MTSLRSTASAWRAGARPNRATATCSPRPPAGLPRPRAARDDEAGAVCTRDGRALQNTVTARIGALRIITYSALSFEGKDPHIEMLVALSRPLGVEHEVSVDWATADGTSENWEQVEPTAGFRRRQGKDSLATAGADYTASSGTMTFAPGEWRRFVKVLLLNDAIDEQREYFWIEFSNPQGAVIAPNLEKQIAFIVNDDHLQSMWLARFGTMAGSHLANAVSDRLGGDLSPGAHATLAGQRLDLTKADDGKGLADVMAGLAHTFGAEKTAAANDDPFGRHGPAGRWSHPAASASGRPLSGSDLLLGSAFHVTPEREGAGPALAAWGRVAHGSFDGEQAGDTGTTRVDGEVVTGVLGADADFGRVLAGVAISLSEGDGTFASSGVDVGARGGIESTLTTVRPYLRFKLTGRVSAWGLAHDSVCFLFRHMGANSRCFWRVASRKVGTSRRVRGSPPRRAIRRFSNALSLASARNINGHPPSPKS